jgi:folate-dependent phosphoribosylglycinamide formyltransferase PurN
MPSSPFPNKRIAVAVSGGGRSLRNLVHSERDFEIAGVISSSSTNKAVTIAANHNLPVLIQDFRTPDQEAIYSWLDQHEVSLLVLAGFLKKFPLRPEWSERIINIHPALLPKYGGPGMYGQRVHEAVLKAKEVRSGATVHYVNEVYDDGEVISQIEVPVSPGDDVEELARKVFAAECELLPTTIEKLFQGEWPKSPGQIERLVYEP